MSTWEQHTAAAWQQPQDRDGAFQADAFQASAFLVPIDTTREWPQEAAGEWEA